MNEELREEIISEITAAFAAVQRCHDTSHESESITLHEADVVDDCGSLEERQHARTLDTELNWQEIPDFVIETNPHVLSFVARIAFITTLPHPWFGRSGTTRLPRLFPRILRSTLLP